MIKANTNRWLKNFLGTTFTYMVLALISTSTFAEGRTPPPSGGGGGGVGISIDIGSVFNAIKNLNKDIPGNIKASPKDSTNCGEGQLCFDVTAPKNKQGTGQATLHLNISQGSKVITTLNSPAMTKSGKYCFKIGPATIQGLDLSKDFDYGVSANYELTGAPRTEQWLGQGGQIAGADNDYRSKCEVVKPAVVVTTNNQDNKRDDDEIERSAREIYPTLKSPKMSVEQFVVQQKAAHQEYQTRKNQRERRSAIFAKNSAKSISTCKANGDFEKATITDWTGENNGVQPRSATTILHTPPWISNPAGISSGAYNADSSHQTLVGPGNDPVVGAPLQMVHPGGGTQSVRIGNSFNYYGAESLSKTFAVTAADTTIGFWYAVVLNDGGTSHTSTGSNPEFIVRILDASGNDITGNRVNLGGNSNKLISDASNPLFTNIPSMQVNWKDWACSQIDLSGLVGQTITIEFETHDCRYGAHWAYAYIDDFCTTCGKGKEGWVEAVKSNPTCGAGKLCFDATMPNASGTIGQAKLNLSIIQNGVTLTTMASPTLTADGQYCFRG